MTTTHSIAIGGGTLRLRKALWFVPFLILGIGTVAQGQQPAQAGVEVLTRGPVHEAFAEVSMSGASAGMVVTKAPYETVSELPPDQRPDGDNIAWIPGYWSFEDDRGDYIWVSGVWRDIPPGRQWIPGYWTGVGDGWQWISGFWGEAAQSEVTYLPQPPEPLEVGPSSPSPGNDYSWTSGSWIWQQSRYDWQPGFWVVHQPQWVWVPPRYTWTPRGHIFVAGYWDHDLVHRGVLFAPVYYSQPVYAQPRYYYSPTILVDLFVLAANLFIQPRHHHYYFGDYYDHHYYDRGYYPWHDRQSYGYDPLYAQYRHEQLRHDGDWDRRVDEQFRYRREHIEARPPQTFALQVNFINNKREGGPETLVIGKSLAEAARSKTQPARFSPVSMDERSKIGARGRDVQKIRTERAKIEAAPKPAAQNRERGEMARPDKVSLPESPVIARRTQSRSGKNPPPAPVASRPRTGEGQDRQVTPDGDVKKETPSREKPNVEARPARPEERPSPAQEKPRKEEAKKETPSRETKPNVEPRPAKPEERTSPAQEKPRKEEAKKETPSRETKPNVEARPAKPEERTLPAQEKPRNVEAKKETPSPEKRPDVQARRGKPDSRSSASQGKPRVDVKKDTGPTEQKPDAQVRPGSGKPEGDESTSKMNPSKKSRASQTPSDAKRTAPKRGQGKG